MRLSPVLLIYFSGILTATSAAIAELIDFWVGWFLLVGTVVPTLIAAYAESLHRNQTRLLFAEFSQIVDRINQVMSYDQQVIDELGQELEVAQDGVWELTEAAIGMNEAGNHFCQYCGSKHSLLDMYPFDPRFHIRDCPIPYMKSTVGRIQLCDPAKAEEYSTR